MSYQLVRVSYCKGLFSSFKDVEVFTFVPQVVQSQLLNFAVLTIISYSRAEEVRRRWVRKEEGGRRKDMIL